VSIAPGASAFTVTPAGPSSTASAFVSAMIAPFAAVYAPMPPTPTIPDTEVTLTIRPPPSSRETKCLPAARQP
jgi:hypothetical protein